MTLQCKLNNVIVRFLYRPARDQPSAPVREAMHACGRGRQQVRASVFGFLRRRTHTRGVDQGAAGGTQRSWVQGRKSIYNVETSETSLAETLVLVGSRRPSRALHALLT